MIISKIEKLDSLFSDESSKRTRRRDFSVHKKKDDEQGSGGAGTDNKLASISTPGTISNISTCQWISPDKTPSLFLIDEDKQCLSIDINTALALITDKVIPELENVFIYKDNKYLILDIGLYAFLPSQHLPIIKVLLYILFRDFLFLLYEFYHYHFLMLQGFIE